MSVSDVVLGVLLHIFARACVAFVIWGGFAEGRRAERDYAERMSGGAH